MSKIFKNIFLNKKIRFIGILVVAVILISLIKLEQIQPSEEKVSPPTVIPTNIPTSIILKPTQNDTAKGTPNFYEKVRPEILKNYPLFDYIPYETKNFKIDYCDPLILDVTLQKDTPEIRQEAYDWILSKGVDLKTHKIIWKTQ